MHGTLNVVATPIGNLEDITLRALRVLREVDMVLCEDTRVTRKLLTQYEIDTPALSYHEHSGSAKYEKVLALLGEGRSLALVTDAGTPGVSDPGARLVEYVRAQLPETNIVAVPGASALTASLSIAGVPLDSFAFFGFPPHKKGRKTFFEHMAKSEVLAIFYESPHRFLKALDAIGEFAGLDRQVVVCRELTKFHEEVVHGDVAYVKSWFVTHPDTVRGEFVVLVSPSAK
jgi:16S rRNA (cytidine1402-2'-O)-methyltransferase